jgi:hypothetical protein
MTIVSTITLYANVSFGIVDVTSRERSTVLFHLRDVVSYLKVCTDPVGYDKRLTSTGDRQVV